jgi:hypothetical protein
VKKVSVTVSLLILAAAFCFAGGGPESAGGASEPEMTSDGFKKIEVDGFALQWKVEGDLVRFRVSAPTTGWVAVGFDPSRAMKDANFIIGYVDGSGASIRDDFGVTATRHGPDEDYEGSGSHITQVEGSETGEMTELGFTIPLESGDSRDSVLVPGQKHKILLAHGPAGADDFSSYHQKKTSLEVTF